MMDNTMLLISRSKYLFELYINSHLVKNGYEGIVPSHGEIILMLKQHKTLKMGELASLIQKDPSTVTTLVKKLEKKGFVLLAKGTDDRRATVAELTPQGETLYNTIITLSQNLYTQIYEGISKDDRIIFRNVLKQININLQEDID